MSNRKNNALDESIIKVLLREADDKVFLNGKRIDYNEHLSFTARHIAQNYHVMQQKAARKAARDAEKAAGGAGGLSEPHQKPQKGKSRALKPRASTLPLVKGSTKTGRLKPAAPPKNFSRNES